MKTLLKSKQQVKHCWCGFNAVVSEPQPKAEKFQLVDWDAGYK
jgi:hypothetical protein